MDSDRTSHAIEATDRQIDKLAYKLYGLTDEEITVVPDSARASGVQQRYFNERGWAILEALDAVAQQHNAQPAQIALTWLLARPSITAPIIGANSPDQLATSLGAVDVKLTEQQIAQLDQASAWQD